MLNDLDIEEEYFTGMVSLIENFYKPCLKESTLYDRSVGFFRSSVFILIGREIITFAKKGSTG